MSELELKGGILDMVSSIEDEGILRQLYQIVSHLIYETGNEPEESLSTGQLKALRDSYEMSFQAENLVDHGTVMEQAKEWLGTGK